MKFYLLSRVTEPLLLYQGNQYLTRLFRLHLARNNHTQTPSLNTTMIQYEYTVQTLANREPRKVLRCAVQTQGVPAPKEFASSCASRPVNSYAADVTASYKVIFGEAGQLGNSVILARRLC